MWHRQSYRSIKRFIDYFNPQDPIFHTLQKMPPIVSHQKIEQLRHQLGLCQENKRILIHTGDCSEPFEHIQRNILQSKIQFFKQIRSMVELHHHKPATIIGRIAGQYAKPRSSEFTIHNGKKIHNYKGDIVNSLNHDQRQPSTSRLLEGYYNSVVTSNYINNTMKQLFLSHQGLILPYEAAFTTEVNKLHYCLSAHMIWIGERTRQLEGGHVQFFRGLSNPIGIKISNNITDNHFLSLVNALNPLNEKGKLMVIVRMGHKNLNAKLQQLISVKQKNKLNFLFVSDPMHGNTYESKEEKLKIRNYEHILNEISIFKKHMMENSLPFGLSLESTHQQVTQCIGGAHPMNEADLRTEKYKSKCDPRLNPLQIEQLIKDIKFT